MECLCIIWDREVTLTSALGLKRVSLKDIYTPCLYSGSDEVVLCENVSVCAFYKVIKQAALCSIFLLDSATHGLRALRADNANVFWPHMVGGICVCTEQLSQNKLATTFWILHSLFNTSVANTPSAA